MLVAANACSAPPLLLPPTARCPNLSAGSWRRVDTVRIAFSSAGPGDRAPNAGLAIATRAADQPLVWYDCTGQLVGGAAQRWTRSGADWTFELTPPYSADSAQSLWLAGVDVGLTGPRRIQVADYAQTRPEWTVESLPYDRLYVLALPDSQAPSFDDDALAAAVQADVRVPGSPGWWTQTGCEAPSPLPASTRQPGVLYLGGRHAAPVPEVLDGKKPRANTPAVRVDTFPGAIWRYSGGGTTIMQLVLMDATGKPFPALLKELVLDPAGTTNSTYEQPIPAARIAESSGAHNAEGSLIPGRWHVYPEMAAAGLWTGHRLRRDARSGRLGWFHGPYRDPRTDLYRERCPDNRECPDRALGGPVQDPGHMIAGDNVLRDQIKEELPLAEYAVVKRARTRALADTIPQAEVQSSIERAAKAAIEKLASFAPYPLAPTYRFEVGFQNVQQADFAGTIPGASRLDSLTLGYTSSTFPDGYRLSLRMLDVVRLDRLRWMSRVVSERADAKAIRRAYMDILVTSWLEPEHLPKPRPAAKPAAKRRYWGDT